MQTLWKWLMQANAKKTFAFSLCALVVAAFVCAWQFAAPDKAEDEAPPPSPVIYKSQIPASIGLLDYVKRQLDDQSIPPVNPFAPSLAADGSNFRTTRPDSPEGVRITWGPNNGGRNNNGGRQNNNGTRDNEAGPAIVTPAQAAVVPPPTLTYNGYMTRADGTPVALVHNTDINRATFVTVGGAVAKATLLACSPDALTLRLPDGAEHTLHMRESVTLK